MRDHPLYSRWNDMIGRCYCRSHQAYKNYGGRGITVDKRWRGYPKGLNAFAADMGMPPALELTLDRINNDGPYSPENCRWATRRTQRLNSRTIVMITVDDVTHCLLDWARQLGVSTNAIRTRAYHRGGDYEAAIRSYAVLPLGAARKTLITVDGVTQCVADWARQLGVSPKALVRRARLRDGNYEAAICSYATASK